MKTKNIKNYSSFLGIVNYRNWLNDSPPLNYTVIYKLKFTIEREHLESFGGTQFGSMFNQHQKLTPRRIETEIYYNEFCM